MNISQEEMQRLPERHEDSKNEKNIISTWTRNCKVFIKTLGTLETSQVRLITELGRPSKLLLLNSVSSSG